MPGSVYGFPDGYVRFTYARLEKKHIKDAVLQFADILSRI